MTQPTIFHVHDTDLNGDDFEGCANWGAYVSLEDYQALKERLARYEGQHHFAVVWSLDDVMMHCEYLTEEQGEMVLNTVERRHDACHGINWDVIEATAWAMFPPPDDEGEDE